MSVPWKSARKKMKNNVMVGYININSIRNKLLGLFSVLQDDLDFLTIAETKLDSSFPNSQFLVKGYKPPFRLDVSDTSGGLLVYIKNGLSAIFLKDFVVPKNIQIIPLQINLKNCKWLILSLYRPPKQDLRYFLEVLSDMIDFYNFEKYIVIGDLNSDSKNGKLEGFLDSQTLFNHVNFNTCFKSDQGSCIDLILSNQRRCLQNTGSFDCGLSDYHHLVYTMLKSTFTRLQAKKIYYRSYRNFLENLFSIELDSFLGSNLDYNSFENILQTVLDRHAPMKCKYIRGNEKPHMNANLKKAIMKHSRLWNVYRKSKCPSDLNAYRVQKNLVSNLNKNEKLSYFNRVVDVDENGKTFWKVCKPFFSNTNSVSSDICLNVNGNFVQDENEVANVFNAHFNNITKSLNLYSWNKLYCSDINDPVFRAIDKFKNHPSVIKIKSTWDGNVFQFRDVSTKEVQEILMNLNGAKKTSGQIPIKILKLSSNIVSPILRDCVNSIFKSCEFPNSLKLAEIVPIPKVNGSQNPGDFRPISIIPTLSKLMKECYQISLANSSKISSRYFSVVFENITRHNMPF